MNGCNTCGSVGSSVSVRPSDLDQAEWNIFLCQCGFREKTEICGSCYTNFPHKIDSQGIEVKCPKCNKIAAFLRQPVVG